MPNETSTFEAKQELPRGMVLPPICIGVRKRLRVGDFLRRTESGGWLYALEICDPPATIAPEDSIPMEGELDDTAASNE